MTSTPESEARSLGYLAGRNGWPRLANPYGPWSPLHQEWNIHFQIGRTDFFEERPARRQHPKFYTPQQENPQR